MRGRQLVHTWTPLPHTRHRVPHPLWPRAQVEIAHFLNSSSHSVSLLIVRRVLFSREWSHSPPQYGGRSSLTGLGWKLKTPFHYIFTQHFPMLRGSTLGILLPPSSSEEGALSHEMSSLRHEYRSNKLDNLIKKKKLICDGSECQTHSLAVCLCQRLLFPVLL